MNNSLSSRLFRNLTQQIEPIENISLQALQNIPFKKIMLFLDGTAQNQYQSNTCRIHPQQPATYFLKQQPWIRLCKQCALNKALCGHQIQKQFTQKQSEKKNTIQSFIKDTKQLINIVQNDKHFLEDIGTSIKQNYDHNILPCLKKIDKIILDLTKIRETISQKCDEGYTIELNQLQQRSDYLGKCRQILKRYLQNMQSSFSDLIKDNDDGTQQFERMLQMIKEQLERTRKILPLQHQKSQIIKKHKKIQQNIKKQLYQFSSKMKKFSELNLQLLNKQTENKIQKESRLKNTNQSFSQRNSFSKFVPGRRKSTENCQNKNHNYRYSVLSQRNRPNKQSSITQRSNGLKQVPKSNYANIGTLQYKFNI